MEIKNKTYKIIKNISLEIKENQITAIIGPSGSGKTTLAQLLSQNNPPSTVGLVTEIKQSKQSIKQEIESEIIKANYKPKNKEKRIIDSLKIVHLDPNKINENPNTLSEGEKVKLALAKKLSYNPKILIIDEPIMQLDAKNKKELAKLIKTMKLRYNKTIIILTKDTDFAHTISDYIYLINNGKIIDKGDKYKIFTNFNQLNQNNLSIPKVIEFSYLIEQQKNVKIGYRDDINDLIKDIYRCIR